MLYSNRSSLLASKKRKLFLHKYLGNYSLDVCAVRVQGLFRVTVIHHWNSRSSFTLDEIRDRDYLIFCHLIAESWYLGVVGLIKYRDGGIDVLLMINGVISGSSSRGKSGIAPAIPARANINTIIRRLTICMVINLASLLLIRAIADRQAM